MDFDKDETAELAKLPFRVDASLILLAILVLSTAYILSR